MSIRRLEAVQAQTLLSFHSPLTGTAGGALSAPLPGRPCILWRLQRPRRTANAYVRSVDDALHVEGLLGAEVTHKTYVVAHLIVSSLLMKKAGGVQVSGVSPAIPFSCYHSYL